MSAIRPEAVIHRAYGYPSYVESTSLGRVFFPRYV